jgi:hypothetical protein
MRVGGEAEQSHGAGAGPVQQADWPAEDAVENLHGQGDDQGCFFGPLQGDGLGREFTDDDVQEGDQAKSDGKGDGVQHRRWHAALEQGAQQIGHGGFADPAQAQGREGDAKLGGGDVGVQVVDEPQQASGFLVAVGGQDGDTRTPHSHQGELRGYEKAVGQDEKGDQKQIQ